MACAVGYPDVLRNVAKIPESKTVVMGVAVGYPDLDAPINRFKRTRADVEDFVTWVE
jgi:nitroreductase